MDSHMGGVLQSTGHTSRRASACKLSYQERLGESFISSSPLSSRPFLKHCLSLWKTKEGKKAGLSLSAHLSNEQVAPFCSSQKGLYSGWFMQQQVKGACQLLSPPPQASLSHSLYAPPLPESRAPDGLSKLCLFEAMETCSFLSYSGSETGLEPHLRALRPQNGADFIIHNPRDVHLGESLALLPRAAYSSHHGDTCFL